MFRIRLPRNLLGDARRHGLPVKTNASTDRMIDLLNDVAEFLEGQSDVDDGSYGEPVPNRAMSLLMAVEQEIERLKRSNGPEGLLVAAETMAATGASATHIVELIRTSCRATTCSPTVNENDRG
jgi:hypothetical protein